jgi:hypothetical protein
VLWPDVRIVHVIRDGHDVALSLRSWEKAERNVGHFPSWHDDPVSTAALFWEWNVRLAREAGAVLGPELYHEVRYEALDWRAQMSPGDLERFEARRRGTPRRARLSARRVRSVRRGARRCGCSPPPLRGERGRAQGAIA